MKIAEGIDASVCIFDIETMTELVDIGIYDLDKKEWIEFEMSAFKNDLYAFCSFYTKKNFDYWVGFNSISFDHQVLQYMVENADSWFDLSGKEIAGKVYTFVQRLIDDQNYRIQPPYSEKKFPVKPIDVFRIHHFNNEARRTSLKWCAFMLNMDVEEMPIYHGKDKLTESEIEIVKNYRRNDVIVTEAVFRLTLGQVSLLELKDYKGKNKLQDRFDVQKETGMDCLNWADVTIGEEWNKLNYIIREAITDERSIYPKKPMHPYGKKFKKYFPKTMKFMTNLLEDFTQSLGNQYVLAEKQEFPIKIGVTTYTIAKGGLHSNEKNRAIICQPGYLLKDADVGGQYPNFIIKDKVYPPHLQPSIIDIAKSNVKNRSIYKAKAQDLQKEGKDAEARPLMGLQEMLKLCNNGGLFGKLGQKGSFLEYPEGLLRVCLGNEMEILMLIEKMESAGIQVISGNTDGIVCYFPEDKLDTYNKICTEWEQEVGNIEGGKLEFTDFAALWQDSINSYIGKKIKKDKEGKQIGFDVKKKGRFMTEFELNKNKSKRIIALALEAYFIEGKNPVDFITNHNNIFDFCIAKKAAGQLHYEELLPNDKVIKHKKLIRYYVSNSGNVFMKRGINNNGDPMNNHCEAQSKDFPWLGQPKLKYYNKVFKHDDFSKYDVNYSYYILETLERIDAILKTKMAKKYADGFKTIQTSLF